MAPFLLPMSSREAKVRQAIRFLGRKWVFHPSNQIQKGNYEPKALQVDVAETFKKERLRLRVAQSN